MEFINYRRPHRAVLRCKAKMQLLQTFDDRSDWLEPDDTLLKQLATALFHSPYYQTLYQRCESPQAVSQADAVLIAELVHTYHQIAERKLSPVVQRLNALL